MKLHEMDGFLKGKCIPLDMKVNETNAEYLVRKFAELQSSLDVQSARSDALAAKLNMYALRMRLLNEKRGGE